MNKVCFSIEQIRATAFKALSDTKPLSNDSLAAHFRGMTMLISALESSARSITDLTEVETLPDAPESGTVAKKDTTAFTGYGAKLKKQTLERLKAARANGITATAIAAKVKGLTETEIYSALNAAKLSNDRWEAIAAALDLMEKERAERSQENHKPPEAKS